MLLILYTLAFMLQLRVTMVITIITDKNAPASISHIYALTSLFNRKMFSLLPVMWICSI